MRKIGRYVIIPAMKNAVSSKNSLWRIVLVIDVIIAFSLIFIIVIRKESKSGTQPAITEPPKQRKISSDKRSNWSMFRGERGLLGRASGTLPDSLAAVWKFKTGGPVKSSPAIFDNLVFIGSSDDNIYAIDLENGKQVWLYKTTDAIESTPCVIEDSVVIGSLDGFLYALNAEDGSLMWKYETEGQILGAANWTRSADGRIWILVGSYDNKLHCVDSTTGKVVWTYETGNYINGSPAVSDQQAVFGGCDAMIHVVSLIDGSKFTEIDSGSYIAASAAFLDGQVYVGNYDNIFMRADIATGKVVWEYKESDAPFFSSPAVDEDVVVFGGRDNKVHCVKRENGKVVWTFQTRGEVDSSPVICGDKVIVGSEDGRLYMIRMSDGSSVWSFETGRPITSSPAVAGGMVVVGCDDGYVYAFSAAR